MSRPLSDTERKGVAHTLEYLIGRMALGEHVLMVCAEIGAHLIEYHGFERLEATQFVNSEVAAALRRIADKMDTSMVEYTNAPSQRMDEIIKKLDV